MLKRTYIENFKCLDKFEINYDNLCLLLGGNGSGKSSLFEVLQKLQRFIAGDSLGFRESLVSDVFQKSELTRWQGSEIQKFELEADGNDGHYIYKLEVEHELNYQNHKVRMKSESLTFNDQLLSKFWIDQDSGNGNAHLYNDDPTHEGVHLPIYSWSQSVIAQSNERRDNTKLIWFKNYVSNFLFVNLNPFLMETYSSHQGTKNPDSSMSNYVSWYQHLISSPENCEISQEIVYNVTDFLKNSVPGFKSFYFQPSGEQQGLIAKFQGEVRHEDVAYKIEELSHGQKALAVLYTLVSYMKERDCVIWIDEPENFISLVEIQPWLDEIKNCCYDLDSQVILTSHHPSIINNLAGSVGYWFSREGNRSATCRKFSSSSDQEGLSIAQRVQLGWIDE